MSNHIDIKNFKENFLTFRGFDLLKEADSNLLFTWRNSDHVRIHMNNTNIIIKENHRQWFKKIMIRDTDLYFIYRIEEESLGLLCFNHIDSSCMSAEWGFYLGKSNLPKGTGTEMLNNAVLLASNKIGLKKLYANVLPSNSKSHYMHLKLGFKQKESTLVLENL